MPGSPNIIERSESPYGEESNSSKRCKEMRATRQAKMSVQ